MRLITRSSVAYIALLQVVFLWYVQTRAGALLQREEQAHQRTEATSWDREMRARGAC